LMEKHDSYFEKDEFEVRKGTPFVKKKIERATSFIARGKNRILIPR